MNLNVALWTEKMRRNNKSVGDRIAPTGHRLARGAGVPGWAVLAALWLSVPCWAWGQSNGLSNKAQPAGEPIRLSALHPEQMEELRGRPLCVYNFTSW